MCGWSYRSSSSHNPVVTSHCFHPNIVARSKWAATDDGQKIVYVLWMISSSRNIQAWTMSTLIAIRCFVLVSSLYIVAILFVNYKSIKSQLMIFQFIGNHRRNKKLKRVVCVVHSTQWISLCHTSDLMQSRTTKTCQISVVKEAPAISWQRSRPSWATRTCGTISRTTTQTRRFPIRRIFSRRALSCWRHRMSWQWIALR